jgi:hypothetical protein
VLNEIFLLWFCLNISSLQSTCSKCVARR